MGLCLEHDGDEELEADSDDIFIDQDLGLEQNLLEESGLDEGGTEGGVVHVLELHFVQGISGEGPLFAQGEVGGEFRG